MPGTAALASSAIGHDGPIHSNGKLILVNQGGSLNEICINACIQLTPKDEEVILLRFKGSVNEPETINVRFVTLDKMSKKDIPVSAFALATLFQMDPENPETVMEGTFGTLSDCKRFFLVISRGNTAATQYKIHYSISDHLKKVRVAVYD